MRSIIIVYSRIARHLTVPRGFAYAEVFNYIMDDNNLYNYNNLKNNLIASTALHSASVIFNFITVFMVAYYKNKYNIDEISKV